jgi:hypothetical protein
LLNRLAALIAEAEALRDFDAALLACYNGLSDNDEPLPAGMKMVERDVCDLDETGLVGTCKQRSFPSLVSRHAVEVCVYRSICVQCSRVPR